MFHIPLLINLFISLIELKNIHFTLVFKEMVFLEKINISDLVGFVFFSLIWKKEYLKSVFAEVSTKFCAFHSVDLFRSSKLLYFETHF